MAHVLPHLPPHTDELPTWRAGWVPGSRRTVRKRILVPAQASCEGRRMKGGQGGWEEGWATPSKKEPRNRLSITCSTHLNPQKPSFLLCSVIAGSNIESICGRRPAGFIRRIRSDWCDWEEGWLDPARSSPTNIFTSKIQFSFHVSEWEVTDNLVASFSL